MNARHVPPHGRSAAPLPPSHRCRAQRANVDCRERATASEVAWMRRPSTENAATGWSQPASNRDTRWSIGRSGPARSCAATRIAKLPSDSVIREQRHANARPTPAPNPRNCTVSGEPSFGSLSARSAICAEAGWPASNFRARMADDVAAPKIAAPVGLAQRMRDASMFQSHAGNALTASGAIRSSRNRNTPLAHQLITHLVSRFRSSHHCWRPHLRTSELKDIDQPIDQPSISCGSGSEVRVWNRGSKDADFWTATRAATQADPPHVRSFPYRLRRVASIALAARTLVMPR